MLSLLFKGLVLWPWWRCTAWLSPVLQQQFEGGARTCWEDDEVSEWTWRINRPAANWCKC